MMPFRTAIVARTSAQRMLAPSSRCLLSTHTVNAVEKLRNVLEEYRSKHYTQEIPTRFKKDIVRAAATEEKTVEVTGLQRVLSNIGASHTMSAYELQSIFAEVGNKDGRIPTQTMVQLL